MTLRFLAGGGSMGAMLRSLDATGSPLGPPAHWPIALRSLVGIMLSAPQPMFLAWGKDQLMVYNDAYMEILGDLHPALGKPFAQVWAEVMDQVGPIMQRAYDGQPTYMDDIELVLYRHGRPEETHFSFFYTPIRGDSGDVEGVFCACTETTRKVTAQRSRAEELAREKERIWRNSPDLMAVLGPDGIFTEVNPAWTQILGWAVTEVVGKSINLLIHPDDLASAQNALARARVGVLPTFECRFVHRDASYRSIAWTAVPDGTAVFAFGRDVTAQKTQVRALELAEEQLRQSQKMEAIGQLTGGIAHDFNNMLASIYGSIQLMQRRVRTGQLEGLESLLEKASTSTQRAAALTQRLLAFARRQPLDTRRVDVVRLVESLEDMFVRAIGSRNALKIRFGPDLWAARIDAGQLESALLNLVINARDAMPEGGQLTLTVDNLELDAAAAAPLVDVSAGDYVALRVIDNGAGMPASVIARAFDPFFTTKPVGQGTGLGLSMVYGFAKQAGGHVSIESKDGNGTIVSLFLPRDLSPDSAIDIPRQVMPVASQTVETILVVEDDEAVRSIIAAVLEDLGYPFIEAADAVAALAVIDSGRVIDLLVTDVGLPGMNGRQLAEIAMARKPGLKVLFVTGYVEQAAQREGFLSAGMQMIAKPFVITELVSRIRSMLAKNQPAATGSTASAASTGSAK